MLEKLPIYTGNRTRSISPENPTGAKGRAAMADPSAPGMPFDFAKDMGVGWKVRPFEKMPPHTTITLADVQGSGVIQHIWIATTPGFGRQLVLRMYWDGEDTPSVEAPLADFFAIGHDMFAPVNSLPVVCNEAYGLNCYWPMPFGNGARITITNDGDTEPMLVTYQITYAETDVPGDMLRFHAQWRRAQTDPAAPDHTIVDGLSGKGHYCGTFLAWTALSAGWFGEGEIKFYIDGDTDYPTICGTGTEDYLGAAWGFPALYSTPFLGVTMKYPPDAGPREMPGFPPDRKAHPGPQKWSIYRWHVMDPICFGQDLRVTIQALGWYPNHRFKPLDDDIASVAYWYQSEPHAAFPSFPELKQRWPR